MRHYRHYRHHPIVNTLGSLLWLSVGIAACVAMGAM